MRNLAVLLLLLLAVASTAFAAPPAAPSGWSVTPSGKSLVYAPGDLRPGETYRVTVYPKASLGGLPLGDAMQRFCDKDAAALGTAAGEQGKVEVTTGEASVASATCQRTVVTAERQAQKIIYAAVSLDGRTVEVARVVLTLKPGLIERYTAGTQEIIKALPRALAADAAPEAPPPSAGRLPFTPPDLATVGGKIMPGRYTGDYVQNGKVLGRRTIYLYASGDYRLLNDGKEPDFNTGKVGYDPSSASGMMMINKTFYDLFNDAASPSESYCFYGHDTAGVPMIYGHRGYPSVIDQVLRYAGPPDRPSPTEVATREANAAAARKEAERYKYVTTPTKGIADAQIAGVVMHFEMGVYFAEMNTDTSKRTLFLLLKDGTYHEDLPVAPCVIDEAVSRRRESEKWGTWKRAAKPGFLSLTPGTAPHKTFTFEALPMLAARPSDLHGHFGRATSTGSILGGGSVTQWGIAFGGGRFQADTSFSFSNGSVAQSDPLAPVMVYGGSDSSGSYVSASGSGATVTEQSRRAARGGDRAGTYELRGYSLILHYDNGVTEYTPCYFENDDRKALRFHGGLYFSGL